MRKNTALKVLNPILAILIVTQVLSGMLGLHLPVEVFDVVHRGGALALSAGVVLHVALNWNWIHASFLRRRRA